MIDELNRTVARIEDLEIGVPYLCVQIEKGNISMLVTAETFDKITEEVDPILVLRWPNNDPIYTVELSILIGSVRVFALYEV